MSSCQKCTPGYFYKKILTFGGKETYLRITNETNEICKGFVWSSDSFHFKGKYIPEQFHNVIWNPGESHCKQLLTNSLARKSIIEIRLTFNDGRYIKFRIDQKRALNNSGDFDICGKTDWFDLSYYTKYKSLIVIVRHSIKAIRILREERKLAPGSQMIQLSSFGSQYAIDVSTENLTSLVDEIEEQDVVRRIEEAIQIYNKAKMCQNDGNLREAIELFRKTSVIVNKISVNNKSESIYNFVVAIIDCFIECGSFEDSQKVIDHAKVEFKEEISVWNRAEDVIEERKKLLNDNKVGKNVNISEMDNYVIHPDERLI